MRGWHGIPLSNKILFKRKRQKAHYNKNLPKVKGNLHIYSILWELFQQSIVSVEKGSIIKQRAIIPRLTFPSSLFWLQNSSCTVNIPSFRCNIIIFMSHSSAAIHSPYLTDWFLREVGWIYEVLEWLAISQRRGTFSSCSNGSLNWICQRWQLDCM